LLFLFYVKNKTEREEGRGRDKKEKVKKSYEKVHEVKQQTKEYPPLRREGPSVNVSWFFYFCVKNSRKGDRVREQRS
jgi:hypothetical protein